MKNCESYEAVLSAWLDGELAPESRVEALDHLVRCESCRCFYREARSLAGLVAFVRTEAVEPGLPAELWKSIERRAARRSALTFVPASVLRAAAVLLVSAGLAFALWKTNPEVATLPTAIDVRLGEDRGRMTDARFFELATELLRSDRRYQLAAFEVMRQVTDDTRTPESSKETLPRTERGDVEETKARRLPA